jgi:hypothetical protein
MEDGQKKVGYRDASHMSDTIDRLLSNGQTFTLKKIGLTTSELILPNRKIKSKNNAHFFKGSHVIKLFLKEVKKRVEEGDYIPKNNDPARRSIKTVMYDPENIKKLIDKPCVAVDINGCYWNTAHKIGVISNQMYEKGMSGGDAWKKARNAAIGSLNASIKEYEGKNGELVLKSTYRRPHNTVRLDIIDHVWNTAIVMGEELKEGFLMYLTDCFFVTKDLEGKVYDLLERNGYSGKSENVIFDSYTDNRIFKVYWSTKQKDNKSHSFTERNIVPWKKDK